MHDLRYALRGLVRHPGFTAVAVVTLALGIGATTAMFSVVRGVLLRPLPYAQSERLVRVAHYELETGQGEGSMGYETLRDLEAGLRSVDGVAGISPAWNFAVGTASGPERLSGYWVSGAFFPTLGVPPLLGRALGPADDQPGADPAVVLSQAAWQRHFGGDPDIIGRGISIDLASATVVGVMPADFRFGEPADLWVALAGVPLVGRGRQVRFLEAFGRLAPGVTGTEAAAEVEAMGGHLLAEYPEAIPNLGLTVKPLLDDRVGSVRNALWLLLGGVGFVLLIACANIGNLQLARAAARRREMGVRAALGASRRRVVKLLLTESLVLAAMGGALGVMLAFWGVAGLQAVGPDLPRLDEIGVDPVVLGFSALLSMGVGVLLGLAPAAFVVRDEVLPALRGGERGTRGGERVRGTLIVAQTTLAVVLLVGATLLLRSFAAVLGVDAGFDAQRVLTLQFSLPSAQYPDPPARIAFLEALEDRLNGLPDVRASGVVTRLPLGPMLTTMLDVEGRPAAPGREPEVEFRRASAGYLAAMGIPLLTGRMFDGRDASGAPGVVLVNRTLAQQLWPEGEAVGRRVRFHFAGMTDSEPWLEVIGVVADVRHHGLERAAPPEVYVPVTQGSTPSAPLLAVRTTGNPMATADAVRGVLRAMDPEILLWDVRTMEDHVSGSLAERRFMLALSTGFALFALALAALGLYALMRWVVRMRGRELGIRIALGAGRREIIGLVLGWGMRLTGLGIVVGVILALGLTRLLRGLLFAVSPGDPVTFAAVLLVMGSVSLCAAWIPARRAAHIQPMEALRLE